MRPGSNAIEANTASQKGDGLIREDFPGLMQKDYAALTTTSKHHLLQRIYGRFVNRALLHAIADLSRRLGNRLAWITVRPHTQLRAPCSVDL